MRVDPEKAPERGVNPCQRDWAAKAAGEPVAEIFNLLLREHCGRLTMETVD